MFLFACLLFFFSCRYRLKWQITQEIDFQILLSNFTFLYLSIGPDYFFPFVFDTFIVKVEYSIPTLQTELMFNEPIVLNDFFLLFGSRYYSVGNKQPFCNFEQKMLTHVFVRQVLTFYLNLFSFLLCVKPIW